MKSIHRRTFAVHVVVLEAADLSRTRAGAEAWGAGRVMDEHVGDGGYPLIPSSGALRAPLPAGDIGTVVGEHWKQSSLLINLFFSFQRYICIT